MLYRSPAGLPAIAVQTRGPPNLRLEPTALSRLAAEEAGPAIEISPVGALPVPRGGSAASRYASLAPLASA